MKNAQRKSNRRRVLPSSDWQVQTAKARFSELFRKTRSEGPQRITKNGGEAVVMIPEEEFDRLTRRSKQPESLVEFFRKSPLVGSGINLDREDDFGRDIDL